MLTLCRSHPFFLIAIHSPVSNFLSALCIKKDNKEFRRNDSVGIKMLVAKVWWPSFDFQKTLIKSWIRGCAPIILAVLQRDGRQKEKNPPATCGPARLECLLQQKKQDFAWNRGRREPVSTSCSLISTCMGWHRQTHGHTHMHVHKIFIHSQKDFPKDPVNTWSEKICSYIPSTQLVNSETKEWFPEFLT